MINKKSKSKTNTKRTSTKKVVKQKTKERVITSYEDTLRILVDPL